MPSVLLLGLICAASNLQPRVSTKDGGVAVSESRGCAAPDALVCGPAAPTASGAAAEAEGKRASRDHGSRRRKIRTARGAL
jgi:hypothetical protein